MRFLPLALLLATAGCQPTPISDDPAAQLAAAHAANKITLLLVVDTPPADTLLRAGRAKDAEVVVLDLSHSRARATAIPFKAVTPPHLIITSPEDIILSRDDASITSDLIKTRLTEAREKAPQVDAEYRTLSNATKQSNAPADHRRLADFLLARKNCRQAIPILKAITTNPTVGASEKIAATVDLCRSHLWVGEPEKSRHTAQNLEATLGPTNPEAIAAANLIFATQDIAARRPARARAELEKAIAAAPHSPYGQEAATMLAKLPPTP